MNIRYRKKKARLDYLRYLETIHTDKKFKPLHPPHLTNNMRMIVRAETRAVKKEQTR